MHKGNVRVPLVERFWPKVDRSGGPEACWPFTAARDKHGYGYIGRGGGQGGVALAHRVAWELTVGPIPDGLCIRHQCDFPPCCNPAHMLLGTKADNQHDMKERARSPRGPKHWNSRLTAEAILEIRRLYAERRMSQRQIAKRFDISQQNVSWIVNRKSWDHVI